METNKSITVMIPAYNEEKNLTFAVKKFESAVKEVFEDYEFIIFNDCSTDKTKEIADNLSKENKKILVVHNKQNMGIGYNYREGIKLSQKKYYMMIPGEGEVNADSIKELLKHVGESDILIPYIENSNVRAIHRRIISKTLTTLLNFLFCLNIKYYNGSVIHKTDILRKVKMTTNSSAYQVEILIRLLKKGYSYKELPYRVAKTNGTESFRIKNLYNFLSTILKLFYEIIIKNEV